MRIAFLEDDSEQADRISALLESGHKAQVFDRGRQLLARLRSETFDLIILDWEVPDISGYEVLRSLRGTLKIDTPVLFLTHRDSESDVVRALQEGADDFLIKPPREHELLARIQALGRRAREPKAKPEVLEQGPFRIDLQQQQITRDGVALDLTRREFEVAALLFVNLGKVLSRGYIMDRVWGAGDTSTTRTVDMHVSRVRKVLGLSAAIGLRLTAIYGYGYRLEASQSDPA